MDLLLVPFLILMSAFFSASETALYSMSQVRMNYQIGLGLRRAKVLGRLYRPLGPSIITILIGNNIVAELLARISEQNLSWMGGWSVVVATLVLTPVVIIFGEYLPKRMARTHSDQFIYQIVYGLAAFRIILAVPVILSQWATRFFQFFVPGPNPEPWEPHTSRPNLRTFLRAQGDGEHLTEVQQKLVDRTLALERITLAYGRASRPLDEVEILDSSLTAAAVRASLGPTFYQRYLVGEGSMPSGWISAQALVMADDDALLGSLAQPLPRLRQDAPLHQALQQMHALGADLALVTDRIGRVVRVAFRSDCLRLLLHLDKP